MKPRTLLILFLLVAGLGAFIWFVERDLPSTEERAEMAKKVLPLEVEDVEAVVIERDGLRVRFEKAAAPSEEGGSEDDDSFTDEEPEWRLTEPLEARADRDDVAGLVRSLTDLEKERTIEDVEPADVGLDAPRASVRVTAEGEDWVLQVGPEIPASSNVMVGLEGRSESYVVSGSFYSELEKEPGDWRSKEAFPSDEDDIRRIRLPSPEGEIVLERVEDSFRLSLPFSDEADEDKVDDLLDAITGLEVAEFLDDSPDLPALGLAQADFTVSVEVDGLEEPVEIRLGTTSESEDFADGEAGAGAETEDANETRYAWVDGQVFETETNLASFLSTSAADWQSTSWTDFEVFRVDSYEIRETGSGDDAPVRFERSSGDWMRDGEEIGYTTASDVLYELRDAKAESVVSRSELADLGEPVLEVTLASRPSDDDEESPGATETLRLYPPRDGSSPAEREGRDALILLSQETVDGIREKIDAARTAEPIPAEPEAVEDEDFSESSGE